MDDEKETKRLLQRAQWVEDMCRCRLDALDEDNKHAHSVTFSKQIELLHEPSRDSEQEKALKAERERRAEVKEIIRKAEAPIHIASRRYVDREREKRDAKLFALGDDEASERIGIPVLIIQERVHEMFKTASRN